MYCGVEVGGQKNVCLVRTGNSVCVRRQSDGIWYSADLDL